MRWLGWLSALIVAGGCGRYAFDPRGLDAGNPSDGDVDAEPLGMFSAPVHLTALAAVGDDGQPTLAGDGQTMYFKSERPGGSGNYDIWRTTRSGTTWTAPAPVGELGTAAEDSSPELSSDGLTLWIASTRAGGAGDYDIWVATRPSLTAAWSMPVVVPELSSAALEEGVTVLPSQLVAYLHSTRGDGTTKRLYRSTRASVASPWSTPGLIAELAGGNHENPWVAADDCTMYFQSDRGGGAADIWITTRATPADPWGAPEPVGELNSAAIEGDPWLSADQRTIVYGSSRGGSFDLYEAAR